MITAIGGTAVTSTDSLAARLAGLHPGQTVTIAWTDAAGQGHTAKITLASGPAD